MKAFNYRAVATLFLIGAAQAHANQTLPADIGITAKPAVDLVAKGVAIGGQFVNVGGVETIRAHQAKAYANGKCLFSFQYNVKNEGSAKTPVVFRNLVSWDGAVVAQHAFQSLNAGQARDYFFEAWLAPGSHVLVLRADADHAVQETDEANNQRVSRVVLLGLCTDVVTSRTANDQPLREPRFSSPERAIGKRHK